MFIISLCWRCLFLFYVIFISFGLSSCMWWGYVFVFLHPLISFNMGPLMSQVTGLVLLAWATFHGARTACFVFLPHAPSISEWCQWHCSKHWVLTSPWFPLDLEAGVGFPGHASSSFSRGGGGGGNSCRPRNAAEVFTLTGNAHTCSLFSTTCNCPSLGSWPFSVEWGGSALVLICSPMTITNANISPHAQWPPAYLLWEVSTSA